MNAAIVVAVGRRPWGSGAMLGTRPSGHWSAGGRAATSPRSRRRRRGRRPSGTNSCQSPVQPARSRCGQSVGTSQALSRKLQTAASCSRFDRSSLQRNHPVRRRSVWTTTPVTSSGVQRPRVPVDAARTGSRGWCGGARTGRRPAPADDDRVHLAGRQRLAGRRSRTGGGGRSVTSPDGVQQLAVDEGRGGAVRTEVRRAGPSR